MDPHTPVRAGRRTLRLGMFQTVGLMGQWRLPGNTSTDFLRLDHWVRLAQRLDREGIDFLFFADDYSYPVLDGHVVPVAIEHAVQFPRADPLVLLSALAMVTERLGLVATVSTMAMRPPTVARQFATLDHLSHGRIGWNIVTGAGQSGSSLLFGDPLVPHDERYERAHEHVRITLQLWERSWEDDALVADRTTGVYADPTKVHEIDVDGRHHRSRGVFTVPPSPQRTPVLFQAGTSAPGRAFAAEYAEAVFLAAEPAMVASQIADVRARLVANGRGRDAVVFLPAATFVVAPTEREAWAKREAATSFATLEDAAAAYAFFTGLDLLSMDLDRPLATTQTEQGRTNVERFAGPEGPTVRDILEEFQRNHVMGAPFVGTPEQVVDQVEAFVDETDADGLLVQPDPTGTSDDFCDLVLPELRRRGLVAPHAPSPPTTPATLRQLLTGGGPRLPSTHPCSGRRVLTADA